MSTPKKSCGNQSNRLGPREKRALLIMLERDNPPGSPVSLLIHLCEEYNVCYDDVLPKRYQPKELKKEKACKKVIRRLVKADLIRPVFLTPTPNPAHGYYLYRLTKTGRRIAEELHKKEVQRDREGLKKDVMKAVQLLKAQGHKHATFHQIRELLWRLSHGKFVSREEFEICWNKKRLGLMLRRLSVKRVWKWQGGRAVRAYLLSTSRD